MKLLRMSWLIWPVSGQSTRTRAVLGDDQPAVAEEGRPAGIAEQLAADRHELAGGALAGRACGAGRPLAASRRRPSRAARSTTASRLPPAARYCGFSSPAGEPLFHAAARAEGQHVLARDDPQLAFLAGGDVGHVRASANRRSCRPLARSITRTSRFEGDPFSLGRKLGRPELPVADPRSWPGRRSCRPRPCRRSRPPPRRGRGSGNSSAPLGMRARSPGSSRRTSLTLAPLSITAQRSSPERAGT